MKPVEPLLPGTGLSLLYGRLGRDRARGCPLNWPDGRRATRHGRQSGGKPPHEALAIAASACLAVHDRQSITQGIWFGVQAALARG